MILIQLGEQSNGELKSDYANAIADFLKDNDEKVICSVSRGEESEDCLSLCLEGAKVIAHASYFVGVDWVKKGDVAVQVSPKMNADGCEVDYVRMLNDALSDPENLQQLEGLVSIRFYEPPIRIRQKDDLLSIFLITEYINLLQRLVRKGLKKSFYLVEDNLRNKLKGRLLVGHNIRQNLAKGRVTDNVCQYQVYDIDTPENRILKKALFFCLRQLKTYESAFDTKCLKSKALFCKPYFDAVSDEVSVKTIKACKSNPVYKEYAQAVEMAKLLLRRCSYNITKTGLPDISTPPFWIDMSKLFELYVFYHLRQVFTGKKEVVYHPHIRRQEPDYLLKGTNWHEPYVIDAKYKPKYQTSGIDKDDARQISGYARLSGVYKLLGLDEDTSLPIKCLIVYPDQDKEECLYFTNDNDNDFEKESSYVRVYKVGIKLPVIKPLNSPSPSQPPPTPPPSPPHPAECP